MARAKQEPQYCDLSEAKTNTYRHTHSGQSEQGKGLKRHSYSVWEIRRNPSNTDTGIPISSDHKQIETEGEKLNLWCLFKMYIWMVEVLCVLMCLGNHQAQGKGI